MPSSAKLWPESLLTSTEAALTAFEDNLRTLTPSSDEDAFDTVKRLVLALNQINAQHGGAGYETDEREELCDYIDASPSESGINVEALAARKKYRTLGNHGYMAELVGTRKP
ncbi:MAG: hypothetical protein ACR2MP_24550 [Streptosporangiaceae bacterium]